jgi:Tol biopolymer transport system component
MRLQLLCIVLAVTAVFLPGCSLVDESASEVVALLSSSATPPGASLEGIAAASTQANPADDPLQQPHPALPTLASTEGRANPQSDDRSAGDSDHEPTGTAEAPGPTPAPVLRQLTSGGCCAQPTWSADGEKVLYIDRPSEQAPSGLWGVSAQGGEPQFITERLGIYSPDMQLLASLVSGSTVVERVATGEQWVIPNDGRALSFSPDGSQVAWTTGQTDPPFDTAQRQVWVSRYDGSQARQVFSSVGGGFAGWFPDGRLLVSGRVEGSDGEQAYWALSMQQDQQTLVELARGNRLREANISKDGSWLAYMVTFSQDPSQDGLWLVDTQGGDRRRLEGFGSYQWRDGERLLVVPLDLTQPAHRLLQVQAATGEVQLLTDPALLPFKIANGDWSVSPDGSKIVFRSALDGNLWMLELQE